MGGENGVQGFFVGEADAAREDFCSRGMELGLEMLHCTAYFPSVFSHVTSRTVTR